MLIKGKFELKKMKIEDHSLQKLIIFIIDGILTCFIWIAPTVISNFVTCKSHLDVIHLNKYQQWELKTLVAKIQVDHHGNEQKHQLLVNEENKVWLLAIFFSYKQINIYGLILTIKYIDSFFLKEISLKLRGETMKDKFLFEAMRDI